MADNGVLRFGEFFAECIHEKGIKANLLIGNTSREIPVIIATSMILYNKYGIDINYSINNAIGKRLDMLDEMILIKDTLTSGNTLKATLTQIRNEAEVSIPNIIVAVDRMEPVRII